MRQDAVRFPNGAHGVFASRNKQKGKDTMEIDKTANDDTPEALRAAAHNYKLVRDEWCRCLENRQMTNVAYYRSPTTGDHGWLCCQCRGIVQTG